MPKKPLKIRYFDFYGLREEKYKFLESHDIKNTDWQELQPKEPHYFFVPKDFRLKEKYDKFISLKDIFSKNGSGVITRRDEFVVAFNLGDLKNRIRMFLNRNLPKEAIENGLSIKDTYEWSLEKARENVQNDKDIEKKYFEYLYRPFDIRWIIYHESLISRPSTLLKQSFPNHENIGLVCSRKTATGVNFNHVLVSNLLADIHSAADQSYVFPLFIYSANSEDSLFNDGGIQQSNFNPEFWQKVKATFVETVDPWSIFNYIYAILYSNIYRQQYNEFLKIDFPRIPFAKDLALFNKLAKLGEELVNLHLLKSRKLENITAKFPISGDSRVKKRQYEEKSGRIYTNDVQYFEGVTPEVWNYYIGGYQVLDKWLKDRIDRVLSPEDVNYFLKVITALKLTIELQKEIDKLYPEIEKGLI